MNGFARGSPTRGAGAKRLRGCTKTGLPSVARPALLRPVGPQASSGKLPGLPKAPPLGELSPKVTERARTLTKNRRRSDSIALPKRQLIAAWQLPGDGLALSVTADAVPPLPRGEALACGGGRSTTYDENMNKNSKKPYRSRFRSAIIFYACYKNLK